MRSALLSFTIIAAFAATPVLAQAQTYYGGQETTGYATPGFVPAPPSHQPLSRVPTNINPTDTQSRISPSLPEPDVGSNADAAQYLRAAQQALRNGQTGEAQSSLSHAETFLLNRSVEPGATNQPDMRPAVTNINEALQALAAHDHGRVFQLIQQTIPMTENYRNQSAMNGERGEGYENNRYQNNGYRYGNQPNSGQPYGMNNGSYQSGENNGYGYPNYSQPMQNGYQANGYNQGAYGNNYQQGANEGNGYGYNNR